MSAMSSDPSIFIVAASQPANSYSIIAGDRGQKITVANPYSNSLVQTRMEKLSAWTQICQRKDPPFQESRGTWEILEIAAPAPYVRAISFFPIVPDRVRLLYFERCEGEVPTYRWFIELSESNQVSSREICVTDGKDEKEIATLIQEIFAGSAGFYTRQGG